MPWGFRWRIFFLWTWFGFLLLLRIVEGVIMFLILRLCFMEVGPIP
jgi:hypothetical protein